MSNEWRDYSPTQKLVEEELEENNSLRKMLRLVGTQKQVVDFGCATGYFSQLLRENGCRVTGIEINLETAKAAEQYCEEVIVADLDLVSITEILPNQKFDVAIFGDVLEHLRNPQKVLEETKYILKSGGYVVASVPNIAHGAMRLALLQGRFEYKQQGILDETHLRFFTRKTVEDLFERSGYFLDSIDCTKIPIFSGSSLIPQVDVSDFNPELVQQIQQDNDSDTLQFILRVFPLSSEGKYTALSKRYFHLINQHQQTQAQLQEVQHKLEQSQVKLQQTQANMERAQAQLQQTQVDLLQSQAQLQQAHAELKILTATVHSIQTSKLWRLRTQWLKLKKLVSLAKET